MVRCGFLLGLLALSLAGCRGGLRAGLFERGGLLYRVLEPQGSNWRRVDFEDNDLAWLSTDGHVLSINATCAGHEDPPLEVLTNHLLIGFTEREWVSRKKFELDGREALRSQLKAKLDGVSRSVELVVLKKNGCVHDFTHVSPVGQETHHRQEFDALVAGFKQERTP